MCIHTGYQLKLEQYPPPQREEGCGFQMEEQFWISQRVQVVVGCLYYFNMDSQEEI